MEDKNVEADVNVSHLRSEAWKLNSLRQYLTNQLKTLTRDTNRLRFENEHVVAIKTDIDGMRKDLVNMRRDYETLKKTNGEHMIQKEAMAKNLISMACEIEKLRGEHMRTRGLGGGGYGVMNGSPVMRYSGGGYGDVFFGSLEKSTMKQMRTSHVDLVYRANLKAGQVFGIAGAEHPKKASRSCSWGHKPMKAKTSLMRNKLDEYLLLTCSLTGILVNVFTIMYCADSSIVDGISCLMPRDGKIIENDDTKGDHQEQGFAVLVVWLHEENEKLLERLTETASSMEQPIQSKVVNAGDSVVPIWNATCDDTGVGFTDIIYEKADSEAIAKVNVMERKKSKTMDEMERRDREQAS
ncbi:FLX-like protein 3 [Tanacetum coccineum]